MVKQTQKNIYFQFIFIFSLFKIERKKNCILNLNHHRKSLDSVLVKKYPEMFEKSSKIKSIQRINL